MTTLKKPIEREGKRFNNKEIKVEIEPDEGP